MPIIAGTWATAADVLAVTGQTVDTAEVTRAQGVIDIYSNVTIEASGNVRARDARLLSMAVCYQTAWQANQIDVMTRTDVQSLSQDGASFTTSNDEALVLAPLAKRCLDRLSWAKPRSLRVKSNLGDSDCERYPTIESWQRGWLRDSSERPRPERWR